MNERHVDLKKAYELIIGNKVFSDKKKINWEALVDQFVNEERDNRGEKTKGDLRLRMKRVFQAINTKPHSRKGEQLFKNYVDLFLIGLCQKGQLAEKVKVEITQYSIM